MDMRKIIIRLLLGLGLISLTLSASASIYNSSELPGWADWPMVQRDLNHTGSYLGDLKDVSSVVNFWNYTAGNEVNGQPSMNNGVVFIGGKDGNVYALDLYTGAKKWEFYTSGFIFTGTAVADGQVYVGSSSAYFFALDEETGAHLWNFSLSQATEFTSPVVYKGIVITPEKGNRLNLINSTDGSEICYYAFSGAAYQSAVVAPDADGDVLAYATSSNNEMIGMYLNNCSAKWTATGGADVKDPSYSDNIVYLPADNVLKAYYANNGSIMCTYTTPSGVFGDGIAIKGDYIVATENSAANTVRIWKHNCTVDWTRSNPATTGTAPIVLNETSILFGMNNGGVQLINYTTGSALWTWSGASGIFFNFGLADGIFVAGNLDWKVYAFAQADQVSSISSSSSSTSSSSQSSYVTFIFVSSSSSSSTSSSSSSSIASNPTSSSSISSSSSSSLISSSVLSSSEISSSIVSSSSSRASLSSSSSSSSTESSSSSTSSSQYSSSSSSIVISSSIASLSSSSSSSTESSSSSTSSSEYSSSSSSIIVSSSRASLSSSSSSSTESSSSSTSSSQYSSSSSSSLVSSSSRASLSSSSSSSTESSSSSTSSSQYSSSSSSIISSSSRASLSSSSSSSSTESSSSSTSSSQYSSSSSSIVSSSSRASLSSSSSSSSTESSSSSTSSSVYSSSSSSTSSSSSSSSTSTIPPIDVPSEVRIAQGGSVRIHFLNESGSPIKDASCNITILDVEDTIVVLNDPMKYRGTGRYYYIPRLELGSYSVETECNKTINVTNSYYGATNFGLTMTEGFIPVRPIEPRQPIEDPHFNQYGEDTAEQSVIDEYLSDNVAYQIFLDVYRQVFLQGAQFFSNLFGAVIFIIETIFTVIAILWASFAIIIFGGFFLYQTCLLIYSFTRSRSALDGFITFIRLQALPVILIWRTISTVVPWIFSAIAIFWDVIKFSINVVLKILHIIAEAIPL